MKKSAVIILLLLMIWQNTTLSWAVWGGRVSKYYYASGKLMREVPHNKYGKAHGLEKRYDEEGNVIGVVPYSNGMIQGLQKAFYPDGRLSGQWPHRDDKRHGTSYQYTKGGTILSETEWRTGKQHGLYKHYYGDGNIRYCYTFVNDKRHGPSRYYDQKGQLCAEKIFFQNVCLAWNKYDNKENHIKGKTYRSLAAEYTPVDVAAARTLAVQWIQAVRDHMHDNVSSLLPTGDITVNGTLYPDGFQHAVASHRIALFNDLLGDIVDYAYVSAHEIEASTYFPSATIVHYRILFANDSTGVSFICSNKKTDPYISHVFLFPRTDAYREELDKQLMAVTRMEETLMKQMVKKAARMEDASKKSLMPVEEAVTTGDSPQTTDDSL